MKKILTVAIFILSITVIFSGCSSKEVPVKEVKDDFVSVVIESDNSKQKKLKLSDEDIDSLKSEFEKQNKENFKSSMSAVGKVNKKQSNRISDIVNKAVGKSEIKSKIVSENKKKNTANVEYSVKGIDYYKVVEKYQKEFMKIYNKNPDLTKDSNKVIDVMIDSYEKVLKNPPLKEEVTKVSVTFKNKNGKWTPANKDEFSELLKSTYSY